MFTAVLLAAALHASAVPTTGFAEIGGHIRTMSKTGAPAALLLPVEVRIYSNGVSLVSASADPRGNYLLRVPPGEYWLVVLANGAEVEASRITVGPRSLIHDIVMHEADLDTLTAAVIPHAAHAAWAVGDTRRPMVMKNEVRP